MVFLNITNLTYHAISSLMMSCNIVHQSYQYFFYYFDLIRPFIQLSSSSEIPSSLTILLTYSSSGRTVQNNLNISIHRKNNLKFLWMIIIVECHHWSLRLSMFTMADRWRQLNTNSMFLFLLHIERNSAKFSIVSISFLCTFLPWTSEKKNMKII